MLVALGSTLRLAAECRWRRSYQRRSRYASRNDERFLGGRGDVDETHPAVSRAGGFEGVKFYQTMQ